MISGEKREKRSRREHIMDVPELIEDAEELS
jgi:hypothetical protein